MNVWKNTTLGNGDVAKELVQLFVIADSELKMTWNDARLLVVASGVTSQFQDFCSEIFQDSSQVDGSTLEAVLADCEDPSGMSDYYRHQHAERNFLSSKDDGHDQREMRDLL